MSRINIDAIENPYRLRELGFEYFLQYLRSKSNLQFAINMGNETILHQAIHCFERLVEILPDFYFDWVQLGVLYKESLLNLDGALKCFQKALELKPDYDQALYNIGTIYELRSDRDKALEYKLKAIAMNPESTMGWTFLAISYSLRNERDKAMVCYQKALEISPENQTARNSLSNLLRKK